MTCSSAPKSPTRVLLLSLLLLQSDTADLSLDVDLGDSEQRAALHAQLGPLADPTTALRSP